MELGRYQRRVYLSLAAVVALGAALAAVIFPGRPDVLFGFIVGAAGGTLRVFWIFRLARHAGEMTPSRYSAAYAAGLAPILAALVTAGLAPGLDLHAAAVGVLATIFGLIAGSLLEVRAISRQDAVR